MELTFENEMYFRSKGYGFVMFMRHEDALACLRKLNNNPDIFDKNNVSTFNSFTVIISLSYFKRVLLFFIKAFT